MKATGIVRRIDDLGRVVIPKEIRRTQKIREGMPMEIYTNTTGEVILKKYSPVGEMAAIAQTFADTLVEITGLGAAICDTEQVIAISGSAKKILLNKSISDQLDEVLQSNQPFVTSHGNTILISNDIPAAAIVAYPVVSEGDVMGAIMLIKKEKDSPEIKPETVELVKAASKFLSHQLEG